MTHTHKGNSQTLPECASHTEARNQGTRGDQLGEINYAYASYTEAVQQQ